MLAQLSFTEGDMSPFCSKITDMCATRILTTIWCEVMLRDVTFSPKPGNTVRSGYRVLRAAMERFIPRSVDRNHAGRNAKPEGFSVKRLSPVKHISLWWPSQYVEAKATPAVSAQPVQGTGTTGVREHGMYERLLGERRRSLLGRAGLAQIGRAKLMTESASIPEREVRYRHSSWEVE